jgi:uncharacterized cupredoxin-like copper-binding protein
MGERYESGRTHFLVTLISISPLSKEIPMKYRLLLGSFIPTLLLVILAGCGRSGTSGDATTGASSGPQSVQVTLSNYKVTSSLTTFTAGKSYHFVVTNSTSIPHELMIMQPMQMGNMPMDQMDKMALYHLDQSKLPAQATQSFDYMFPASSVHQPLELSCHLPGHYEAGMHQSITVSR